jgi:probable F420-dependent oxidoreductase
MKVGVVIPNAGPKCSPENMTAVARMADEMGYHSVWVTDHVVLAENVQSYYPYRSHGRWDYPPETYWLDPLLSLCWVAASFPNLQIGTSITVVPLRNPVLLAKQISTLDFLSGGRFILGIGAGWMKEEFDFIGVDFAKRGKRVTEMVRLMRELWAGESVDFKGDLWRIKGCKMYPRPIQSNIPILWGGHSDSALKRVARMGDGWHPTQITLEQLETGIEKLEAYSRESGRDPESVQIVARPGNTYAITPETHARHLELGVDHLVMDTPIKQEDPKLEILRESMAKVAEICSLEPRN